MELLEILRIVAGPSSVNEILHARVIFIMNFKLGKRSRSQENFTLLRREKTCELYLKNTHFERQLSPSRFSKRSLNRTAVLELHQGYIHGLAHDLILQNLSEFARVTFNRVPMYCRNMEPG